MSTHKPTLYMSFDVETDGPSPLVNSLLSIGICGIDAGAVEQFEFSANIVPLPGHVQNADTMAFWAKNKKAWNTAVMNQREYTDVFAELSGHFARLSETYALEFVAAPVGFDWMWLKSYYDYAALICGPFYDIGYSPTCASSEWRVLCRLADLTAIETRALTARLHVQDKKTIHCAYHDAAAQAAWFWTTRDLLDRFCDREKLLDVLRAP